ncbi:MAG: hydrolase [Alphaproteobacteria bacterium]|nr:hydrolase [Alphaproteobacteria bacterium]
MITRAEQECLARIEHASMVAQVQDWAAINTGTGNVAGLKAQAAALAEAFGALPGDVRLVDPALVERIAQDGSPQAVANGQHLIVSVRPHANFRVLLTGHMDTVFGPDHPFQTCRWLDDNTLGGPGVADMKGGIAVMLAALMALEESGIQLGYDVLINSDEETGSLSSAALIAELAQGKAAALTFEPALPDGTLAVARPGSGNFSAIITGKAAHAGRNPEDGRNALVAAADLAVRLAQARTPALGINPAKIDGGGPNNVVPDHAVLRFNLRPKSPQDEAAARTLIARLTSDVEAAHGVHIHLHGGFNRPPKPVTPEAARLFDLVTQAGADLGQTIARRDTGGVCDGNNIAACGVPVVDTMGALGGNIHSSEEFLLVNALVPRAQLAALTLMRLAANGSV